jgi:hypothetical protein
MSDKNVQSDHWIPNVDEYYVFVDGYGYEHKTLWKNSKDDFKRLKDNNVFKP